MLRDTILELQDITLLKVDVPEWNCAVHVKTWNAAERLQFGELTRELKGDEAEAAVRYCARVAVDENGERIFRDEDAPALAKKSGAVINRIVNACFDHNGLNEAVDRAKKN